jgi:hypothetical protein
MNSRLPSAPLTKEDSWVWGFASYPRHLADSRFARSLCGWSMEQDGRDADLMLQAMEMRWVWGKCNPLVASFEDTDKIACGGSLRDLWCQHPHLNPHS